MHLGIQKNLFHADFTITQLQQLALVNNCQFSDYMDTYRANQGNLPVLQSPITPHFRSQYSQ